MADLPPKKNGFLKQLFSRNTPEDIPKQHDQTAVNKELLLEYYSSLALHHPDLIIVLSPEGEVLSQKQSNIHQFLGYVPKTTSDYEKLVTKKDSNRLLQAFEKTLLGHSERHLVTLRNRWSETLYVDLTFIPIKSSAKETAGVFVIVKDNTAFQKLTKELELKEKHLTHAQELADLSSWEYLIEEDVFYFTENYVKLFGFDNSERMSIKELLQIIHPADREEVEHKVMTSIREGVGFSENFRIFHGETKAIRYIKAVAVFIENKEGPSKLIGINQDVTPQQELEKELRSKSRDIRYIFDHVQAGIWLRDASNGTITYLSKGLTDILQLPAEKLSENFQVWNEMIVPAHQKEVFSQYELLKKGKVINITYRMNTGAGTTKWISEQSLPLLNEKGEITEWFGMVTDISSEKELQGKLEFYATHDPITALPNQPSLFVKLDDLCKEKSPFAVLFLDLDRFQVINDSLGYQIGDAVLQKIASRLISVCSDKNFIARLNSNDFIVVMEGWKEKEAVVTLAEEIIKGMEDKIIVDDYELHLTMSIGISFFPEDGDHKKSLLERAHSALNQAKKLGKNNVQLYSASYDISAYKKYMLERDLRKAIAGEEFDIFYQPQVETSSGIIKSAEALLRWQHEEWGPISPKEFILLAEENHLINQITDWMIQRICQQLREWKDRDFTLRPIAINISAVRFLKKGLVELVKDQLERYQISPKYLVFEITESMLLSNDANILATIMALKETGIKIAIDDFGTGFSSLEYLREFPADMIKIDKVFIQSRDGKHQRDAAIVSSILHLAKGLEMEMVAEGVEEHEQLEFLEQKECDFIQGFLFSKPVPAKTFERMMQTGYLRPLKPKIHKVPEVERRKFYRFEFPFSVRAEMFITEVNKRKVQLGKAEILLENISIGGLKILSSLQLPVSSNMKFQFHFVLMGETFKIDGNLIWKNEGKGDTFCYGVEFDIQEADQDRLAKSINAMTTLKKNNQSIPDTYFIQEAPHLYLRK